jgi:signal transduction histidine kinase
MTHVLVAEDEPALLESFCDVVGHLGYGCIVARNGDEALELARTRVPDLIITDYMMPGRSGVELIRALREEPTLAAIPVILVSAAAPRGADEAWRFLAKPVELTALEQCLVEGTRLGRERRNGAGKALPARAPAASRLGLAREEMLNWVAHEIKSPLSAAVMCAHLMRRSLETGEPPGVLRKRIDVIVRQLDTINELVTSVLEAARLQDGKLTLSCQEIDLCELLQRTVELWRTSYPQVDFSVVHPDQPVAVRGDRDRLQQILDHLLSNAVKHGQPAGRVALDLRLDGGTALLRVTDFGRGIPAAELPHLFDRFHRVGVGGRGHGLGLYIAAALARLHEGSLSASSEEGKGATFLLTIPSHVPSQRDGLPRTLPLPQP